MQSLLKLLTAILWIVSIVLYSCQQNEESFSNNQSGSSSKTIKVTELIDSIPTLLDPGQYIEYVEDPENGLSIVKDFENVTFQVQYKPLNYLALIESRNKNVTARAIDSIGTTYGVLEYYTLTIDDGLGKQVSMSINKKDKSTEYENRMSYLDFGMQNDIRLVEGNDTLKCCLYHFERSYGVKPTLTFHLAFNTVDKNTVVDKILILDDHLFGLGKVHFTIQKEAILSLPKIDFSNNEQL